MDYIVKSSGKIIFLKIRNDIAFLFNYLPLNYTVCNPMELYSVQTNRIISCTDQWNYMVCRPMLFKHNLIAVLINQDSLKKERYSTRKIDHKLTYSDCNLTHPLTPS